MDVVTCLALDASGTILMSGSKDSTSMLWPIKKQGGVTVGITNPSPFHVLTGRPQAQFCIMAIIDKIECFLFMAIS